MLTVCLSPLASVKLVSPNARVALRKCFVLCFVLFCFYLDFFFFFLWMSNLKHTMDKECILWVNTFSALETSFVNFLLILCMSHGYWKTEMDSFLCVQIYMYVCICMCVFNPGSYPCLILTTWLQRQIEMH